MKIVIEKATKNRAKSTSNACLVCVGSFALLFVAAMIITFWVKGSVPDTLIQYTLGAGGLEALMLAAIKVAKTIKGESSPEKTDEDKY